MKGLLRFALVNVFTMLLTPRVEKLFAKLETSVPEGSFLEEVVQELSQQYAASLVRSVGQTVGELVLGA